MYTNGSLEKELQITMSVVVAKLSLLSELPESTFAGWVNAVLAECKKHALAKRDGVDDITEPLKFTA